MRSPIHAGDLRGRLAQERNLLLAVKVSPRAANSEVIGLAEDGNLRVRVVAVPEKGKANEELRSVLARYFGIPRSNVQILSGETSTHKKVKITAPGDNKSR